MAMRCHSQAKEAGACSSTWSRTPDVIGEEWEAGAGAMDEGQQKQQGTSRAGAGDKAPSRHNLLSPTGLSLLLVYESDCRGEAENVLGASLNSTDTSDLYNTAAALKKIASTTPRGTRTFFGRDLLQDRHGVRRMSVPFTRRNVAVCMLLREPLPRGL